MARPVKGVFMEVILQAASFRDGPKDQTRNLEIPGSLVSLAPWNGEYEKSFRRRSIRCLGRRCVHSRSRCRRSGSCVFLLGGSYARGVLVRFPDFQLMSAVIRAVAGRVDRHA